MSKTAREIGPGFIVLLSGFNSYTTFSGFETPDLGRVILNFVPSPSLLLRLILPLCAPTMNLQILSPSPVPPSWRERDLSTR